MKQPSALRVRLAKRLSEAGYAVDPGDIMGAQGWYRVNQRFDDQIVTWDCFALPHGTTYPRVHLVSYQTMTECARRGVEVSRHVGHQFFVTPKEQQPGQGGAEG